MKHISTNLQPLSLIMPGMNQPVALRNQFSDRLPGLLNNLSVARESGVLSYSETQLCDLLDNADPDGAAPIVHPNLDKTRYFARLKAIYKMRNEDLSPLHSRLAVASMLGAAGMASLYKFGTGLPWSARGASAVAVVFLVIGAVVAGFASMKSEKDCEEKNSYSYLDAFAGDKPHIKWDEYWRYLMKDQCSRRKLRENAVRAKQFGFKMKNLRKPRFTTKRDGTPLCGEDIRDFMLHDNDTGFAAVTSLLWAVEAAQRAVGKPLRRKISASPVNARFFLKLAQALSGHAPAGLSLPGPYSRPLMDLLDSAAYYAGLANKTPTHAAALAAFLARYYYENGQMHSASLMIHSTHYMLEGKWRSAFTAHLAAMKRPLERNKDSEQKAVIAIHHLGIARLMHERMIFDYEREIGLGAYIYASSALQAFDELAGDIEDAHMQWQVLETRAADIIRVMTDNGPFVEFR